MKTYVISGAASGIGAALKTQLIERGNRVISVDIKDADVVADLSTKDGRAAAIQAIHDLAPDGIDWLVPAAGVSPITNPKSRIVKVNFFGALATIEGLKNLLSKKNGAVLVVSSNSLMMSDNQSPIVQACLDLDEDRACDAAENHDGDASYSGSKRAISIWMRRNITTYAKLGVRMTAIAPGLTLTPLMQEVIDNMGEDKIDELIGDSMPGGKATPDRIANVMRYLMSDEADYFWGSIVFCDGGFDAFHRSDQV